MRLSDLSYSVRIDRAAEMLAITRLKICVCETVTCISLLVSVLFSWGVRCEIAELSNE